MTPRPRTAHRELTDFLAFAMAIVFLVRTFVGEPFGVPTGSMAPTLLGAHKLIHCPECNKTFPVGVDDPANEPVVCQCPACGTKLDIAAAPVKSGDRIIVLKGPPTPLKRWDVAVFKFIDEPRKFYVKRIVGLPGERLRIRGGEIEIWNEPDQRWHIARKPAELAKQLAIPVWEEEHRKKGVQEAWEPTPAGSWQKENGEWVSKGAGELRFRRLSNEGKPLLIGDDLGYNFGLPLSQSENTESYWNKAGNPVGDLHVSFELRLATNIPDVELRIARGAKTSGFYIYGSSLYISRSGGSDRRHLMGLERADLGRQIHFHFALVDRRVALWVDGRLVHEWWIVDESHDTPNQEHLTPVRIIANDAGATISNLRVYRDIYYTQQVGTTDFLAIDAGREMMGDAKQFKRFRDARQRTTEFTVPAGSYFVLGDNSIRSHDGRHWQRSHFVDQRMIVGRVLFKLGR
jgi:signal peptidase I